MDVLQGTEAVVKEVEQVRTEIEKQAATGVGGGDAPRVVCGIGVGGGGRGVAVVDASELADGATLEEVADFFEARHGAAIVGDEEFLVRGAEGGDHGRALGRVAGHGFFHVARFAGGRGEQGTFEMGTGRSGNVDGIDGGVVHECAGVVVGARDAVASGVVSGEGTVAAHDGDELGVAGFLETGAALHLGDIAATEDAPADGGARRRGNKCGHGHETTPLAGWRQAVRRPPVRRACERLGRWGRCRVGGFVAGWSACWRSPLHRTR